MKTPVNIVLYFHLALVAHQASAHHSRFEYDMPNPIELTGKVSSVTWRNPHIEFRVTTEAGEEWILESSSATLMNTAGVNRDVIQQGMQVKAFGGTSLRRDNRMLVTNVLLPDGLELVMMGNSPRHWQGETIGVGTNSQVATPSGRLPDDGRGLFRVWTFIPTAAGFWMAKPPEQYPLTEKARMAAVNWNVYDPDDNHVLRCIPPGMPSTMGSPHPMEFIQLPDAIEVHNEEFDVVRTIHMTAGSVPGDAPFSPLGYSIGRWEGDTLLVTTNRIDTPYFNRAGVPLSPAAEVKESFTVDAENGRLEYAMTVTDPENLAEPFTQELTWFWNKLVQVQQYQCDTSE